MNNQIRSKERILNHGEVFTNEEEIKKMVDLVDEKIENIESTILEPACGNGNFLEEVITRRFKKNKKYKTLKTQYIKKMLTSISTVYGIEIQEDNVKECRERLFALTNFLYKQTMKEDMDKKIANAVKFILFKNIVHGNALNMKFEDGNEPLKFTNWSLLGNYFIMEEFYFEDLIKEGKPKGYYAKSTSNSKIEYKNLGENYVQ